MRIQSLDLEVGEAAQLSEQRHRLLRQQTEPAHACIDLDMRLDPLSGVTRGMIVRLRLFNIVECKGEVVLDREPNAVIWHVTQDQHRRSDPGGTQILRLEDVRYAEVLGPVGECGLSD